MKQTQTLEAIKSSQVSLHKAETRAIICFAAAATVSAGSLLSNISQLESIVIATAFAYTLISYAVLKRISPQLFETALDKLSTADAVFIGFILSFVEFSILPTVLFILMIQFNSLIIGGVKKWLINNIAFICGVALTFLFWIPQWQFTIDLSSGIAAIISTIAYFCVYGLNIHTQIRRLEAGTLKLQNEKALHKLRTYKLSRYLTPTVWKAVNEGREESLKTERKRISVFFSDIEGFSSLSEELESETIAGLLNHYLSEMSKIVADFDGNIDKFMGDGLMIIFGDAQTKGLKADCVRCVSMAIEMRKKMKELQNTWFHQGIKKPLRIRMGINTGYCTVGTFGTNHYMDYTALGTHVNLASRLESAADPGEILISHETWSLIKDVVMCRDKGEITVKGFSHPIKVYQVVNFRKDLGRNQSYFEENSEGFSMHLDLDKIRNYDKERIVSSLKLIADRLKNRLG